jgi:alkylation response protein AidB-like acyl-CoA dehydrogenase
MVGAVSLDDTGLSFLDGRVHGTLPMVFDAAGATLPIALTDHGLVAVPGVGPEPVPSVDRTRPVSAVVLDDAVAVLLTDASGELAAHLRHRQLTLYAAEAAGVAAAALERTAAYTVEREQFGRPIGTFQAVKHRLADMLVEVESARSAVYAAAWSARDNPDLAVALAQAVATEAAVHVVGAAIQLHGGIGVTWEHDLHLFLRRAKALEVFGGRPSEHFGRIADALLGLARPETMPR